MFEKDYLNGMPVKDMAIKYKKSENAIRLQASKLKLKRSTKYKHLLHPIEKQKEEIINYYTKTNNLRATAQEFNFDTRRVKKLLVNNGCIIANCGQKRKYTLDETFFESIDTEAKAYFFGLLLADGYVNQSSYLIGITLKKEDKYILELFNKYLQSNRPLVLRTYNGKKYYELRINSKKMYSDLEKLGMTKSKTYKMNLPVIQRQLENHFIRGFFDGDGCISFSEKPYVRFTFSIEALPNILNALQSTFRAKGIFINTKKSKRYKTCPTESLRVSNKKIVNSLYDFLYNNSTIYLKRKHNKFQKIKSHYSVKNNA